MIRPLRRQHRAIILVLAVALAVVFIAGLSQRKSTPTNPRLPDALLKTSAGGPR